MVGEPPEPSQQDSREPVTSTQIDVSSRNQSRAARLRAAPVPSANTPPPSARPAPRIEREPVRRRGRRQRARRLEESRSDLTSGPVRRRAGNRELPEMLPHRERKKHLLPRRDRPVHRMSQREQQSGVDRRIVGGETQGMEAVGPCRWARSAVCSRIRPPRARDPAHPEPGWSSYPGSSRNGRTGFPAARSTRETAAAPVRAPGVISSSCTQTERLARRYCSTYDWAGNPCIQYHIRPWMNRSRKFCCRKSKRP